MICTKRVYNDRLLMFLLRHLKPERYAADALARPAPPSTAVDASLSDMEPRLPAPPEQLLDAEALADALLLADSADGVLPHFLREQRPARSAEQEAAAARSAQEQRGQAAWDQIQRKDVKLSPQEFADMCRFIDPAGRADPPRGRFR